MPPDSTIIVIDRNGIILARHPDSEKWVGKSMKNLPIVQTILNSESEGNAEAFGLDGIRRLYGFTPIRVSGAARAYVGVGITTKVAYADANRSLRRNLMLLGLVGLLALIAAWVGGDLLILRRVNTLVSTTKRLAAGDLSARTGLPYGQSELSQLAHSFDEMAYSLETKEIERKKAEEEVRHNLERIRALHEIDMAITSTLELRVILDFLLEKIDLFIPYAAATTVRLFNKESGELEPVACRNLNEFVWKTEEWQSGRGLTNVVAETRDTLAVEDIHADPRARDREFFRRYNLVSYLGVPLLAKRELLGVLSIYAKEKHQFASEEIEFLRTLASQAAIAIHNAQLYEQTKSQAIGLEKANKVKDEFLSVMSHELRTPLNVVTGYVGMMKDGLLGEINPQQEEALGKVLRRGQDQLDLVNNILFATVLEAQEVKVDSSEVDLADFLKELRSAYEVPMEKGLTLKWDYPSELPFIKTDSAKLKQILQNLINNAIKFTEKGGVTISARITEGRRQKAVGSGQQSVDRHEATGNSEIEFKVADTGIGIPKEHLSLIFEKFRQVDSSETRLFGGVGMGLYIVKKFAEMLGGTVEVQSEPGKGSTFTATLPIHLGP